jgi:phosphatidylglycerophosphate synthase
MGKKFSFLSGNAWTIVGLVLTVIAAYFAINAVFWSAAFFLFIAVACDFIDGAVARYRGEATNIGAYYDTIADRYGEGIIVLSLLFAFLPPFYLQSYFWVGLYLFGSLMTTYAKAAAKEKNLTDKPITGGLVERPERMVLLVLGFIAAEFGAINLTYVIVMLAILTNVTAIQRIDSALKSAKKISL